MDRKRISTLLLAGILSLFNLSAIAETTPMAEISLDSTVAQSIVDKLSDTLLLTPIQNPDVNNLPANTITLYNINSQTGEKIPAYYSYELAQKEYGNLDSYGEVRYLKFVKYGDSNTGLEDGTPEDYSLKLYISNDNLSDRIYNVENSVDINKNFVDINYDGGGDSIYGVALGNSGYINNITGDFVSNYGYSDLNDSVGALYLSARGGAVYNTGSIDNINSDFFDNGIQVLGGFGTWGERSAEGGAIYNGSSIGYINGNFINNTAISNQYAYGGAICNYGVIEDIKGDFIGNWVDSDQFASGGGIDNDGGITSINGNFIQNTVYSTEYAEGGAISNWGNIVNITGNFIGNSVDGEYAEGGAIHNWGEISSISANFVGNYAWAYYEADGGAIYNYDEIGNISGNFIGNHVTSYFSEAKGGAIYSATDLNISSDNTSSIFLGNYTVSNGVKDDNAIYMANTDTTLKLTAKNNGSISFYDNINGETGYNVALKGDETGVIYLNNYIKNANVTLDNTNLHLGNEDMLGQTVSFTANSGSISTINNSIGTMNIPVFNIAGDTGISVDVDLANETMDTISAGSYNISNGAKLNVQRLNLLSDATKESTKIFFAESDLAGIVNYTGANPIAYTPIYKYDVSYAQDSNDNLGYFFFTRGNVSTSNPDSGSDVTPIPTPSGNPSDSFNPAVLPTSVSTTAGAYTTQLQTFSYAFQNSESFMSIPYLERISLSNKNKYALSSTGDATDVGRFSPLFQKQDENNGFWVKPYVSFENIPLKNGPKVSNINYGTMIGYDTDIVPIKNGWNRILTGYIGYNGASQRYSGVDTYQNGGLLGGTTTFYKGNFFNATTMSVGASTGSSTTMYGNEDYAMLLSGIANKAGYNFEFKEGKYIIQPSMLMSYTFVNTFDYTNAAGVRIDSDPLHAIQLAPGLKFIMNTKNGWQPYFATNMVWNLLDKQKVMANDVRLPEMSIKPYIEYGAGIQKRLKDDNFTAFGQAMVHNGGRNGIAFSLGIKWKVGKVGKNDENNK